MGKMKKLIYMGSVALIVAIGLFWSCQKEETLSNPENGFMLKAAGENCADCVGANVLTYENTAQTIALNPSGNNMQATFSHTDSDLQVVIARTSGNFSKLAGTIKLNGNTILEISDNSGSRTSATYTVDLPDTAKSCDDIELYLSAISGVGNPNSGSALYKLRQLCTETVIDPASDITVCTGNEVTITGTATAGGTAFDGNTVIIQEFDGTAWNVVGNSPYTYTPEEQGVKTFRAVYEGNNWYASSESSIITVTAEDCQEIEGEGCIESFSYATTDNLSVVFTYVSEEDLTNAEVKFTCPHITGISGIDAASFTVNPGNGKGSPTVLTWVGDIEACTTYTWDITFTPDCDQNAAGFANIWTDFKVNEVSKKGNLHNIVYSCQ